MSGANRRVTHFVLWRPQPATPTVGERAACGAWLGPRAKRSTRIEDVDCSACRAKVWEAVAS